MVMRMNDVFHMMIWTYVEYNRNTSPGIYTDTAVVHQWMSKIT